VSKSPAVIGAIGFAGCVALSLMLREVLEVQTKESRDPLELALESHFSARLAGRARVSERVAEGRLTLVLELRVLAGLQKRRLVMAAGRLAWQHRSGTEEQPHEVEVIVTDDGDGESMSATVPRPPYWR